MWDIHEGSRSIPLAIHQWQLHSPGVPSDLIISLSTLGNFTSHAIYQEAVHYRLGQAVILPHQTRHYSRTHIKFLLVLVSDPAIDSFQELPGSRAGCRRCIYWSDCTCLAHLLFKLLLVAEVWLVAGRGKTVVTSWMNETGCKSLCLTSDKELLSVRLHLISIWSRLLASILYYLLLSQLLNIAAEMWMLFQSDSVEGWVLHRYTGWLWCSG